MTYKQNTIVIRTWSHAKDEAIENIASKYSNMKQNTTEAKKINMFKTIRLTRLFLRD